MDDSQLRFQQLNLARVQATRLSIFARYHQDEERLALLPRLEKDRPEGEPEHRLYTSRRYKTRGANAASYRVAGISHSVESPEEIHVAIHYRKIKPNPQIEARMGVPEEQFWRTVYSLGEPKELMGLTAFQFESRREDLWFPLPVVLTGSAPEDIVEIRGVRGGKPEATNSDQYEFTLDHVGDGKYVLVIEQPLEGPLNATLPARLLNSSVAIARTFVTGP